jgi:hypothetical protein
MVSEWLEREEKQGLEYEVDDTSNEEVESGSDYEGENEDEDEDEERTLKRPRIEKITTSDNEDDDEDNNTNNDGITIEEFSMKQENRRGRFDENGMYVAYGGYNNEDDEELIGIVEVADEEMEKARTAEEKRIQLLESQQKIDNETKVNKDQLDEVIKKLLKHVREGETISKTLQRLNWKRKQLNKRKLQRKIKIKMKKSETITTIDSTDYEINEIIDCISILEKAYINNNNNNNNKEIDIMELSSQQIKEFISK